MTDTPAMNPQERDSQAAEYVLGTLSLEERLAFERAMASDPELQRAVAAWAARLQPLADSVAPVTPPESLRPQVLGAIGFGDPVPGVKPFNILRWLSWTFGLSALAGAAAVVLVLWLTPQPPTLGGYAMLHDAVGSESVVVFQVDEDVRHVVVLASAPAPEEGRDYELWLLPPEKDPISLGVVKAGVREERPLPPDAAAFVKDGTALGVSLEPAGGAPEGKPTGPVVFSGTFRTVEQP